MNLTKQEYVTLLLNISRSTSIFTNERQAAIEKIVDDIAISQHKATIEDAEAAIYKADMPVYYRVKAAQALEGVDKCSNQEQILKIMENLRNTEMNDIKDKLLNLKHAVDERIDLHTEMCTSGTPPHTDFWHQSIWEANAKIKKAYEELF